MMKTLALLSVSLLACGKSKGGSSAPAAEIDVAAVNALVPANLKDKVVFEKREVVEERGKRSKTTYTLAAPKDWQQGDMKMFAKLRPKDDAGYSNFTEISVGSNCDGECVSKDWAATSEKVNFKQFRGDNWKIIKDEPTKTNHLLIAQQDKAVFVMYAWWTDGASKYYTCSAHLEPGFGAQEGAPSIADAAPAFAKACQAVNVSGD